MTTCIVANTRCPCCGRPTSPRLPMVTIGYVEGERVAIKLWGRRCLRHVRGDFRRHAEAAERDDVAGLDLACSSTAEAESPALPGLMNLEITLDDLEED